MCIAILSLLLVQRAISGQAALIYFMGDWRIKVSLKNPEEHFRAAKIAVW
jgi:hypothetical protein